MDSRLEYSLPVITKPQVEEVQKFVKGEDIEVSPGNSFTYDTLEVQPDDLRREYFDRREYGDKPGVIVHWGQRKLLINEIAFLTYFWDPEEVPEPVIVYAGAAPGDHTPILAELFPQIYELHLYDPARFSVAPTRKIFIYRQLFENEDAEVWTDRNDVFFISDIRLRPGEYEDRPPEENEKMIVEDNQRQRRWVEIIKPVEAHLKFRPPFPIAEEFEKLEYLDGDLFYQPWAPESSAETRLVPSLDERGRYRTKIWDSKKHEEQMFYHNTVLRDNLIYSNPFLEAPNEKPIDPPELLNDYDSVAEAAILRDYLEKMGKENDEAAVVELSRHITKRLNERSKVEKSIDGIRNFTTTGRKILPKSKGRSRGRGKSRGRGGKGRGKSRGRGRRGGKSRGRGRGRGRGRVKVGGK